MSLDRRDFLLSGGAFLAVLGLSRLAGANDKVIENFINGNKKTDWGPYKKSENGVGCEWKTDEICGGNTKKYRMFEEHKSSFEIFCCDRHFHDHLQVRTLDFYGVDIEEVINMTFNQRAEKIRELNLTLTKRS